MPRIRTLKPEYWGDEKLGRLPPLHRLVFLGLISHADDAGRLVDNVKTIDGFLFPFSTDTSAPALDELAKLGRIDRYEADNGQRVIQITHWSRHQKVDHPSKHVLPGRPERRTKSASNRRMRPTKDSRDIREGGANDSGEVREVVAPDLGPRTIGPRTEDPGPRTSDPSRGAVTSVEIPTGGSGALGALPSDPAPVVELPPDELQARLERKAQLSASVRSLDSTTRRLEVRR